jgi:hypothetical protein
MFQKAANGCPCDDLALPLTSGNPDGADSYGALNLYSDSIDPFGPNECAIAQALAAKVSVALVMHGRSVDAASP